MSNTLIVRDATLAINGAADSGTDPEAHIQARIEEAKGLDPETVADCADVLRSSAGASGGDPDVLEALVVMALAHPAIAEEYELSPQVMGRRLAARLERTGEAARALAVLNVLLEYFPASEALEREMSALMRRQGMVQDLAERYLERAEKLLAKGHTDEAIAWFREVLMLDRSRTDIARRIRELKNARAESSRVSSGRRRWILASLLLSASMAAVVQRETNLHRTFGELPATHERDVDSIERRLSSVERFIADHPLWHGSLNALAERNHLRAVLKREEARLQREAIQASLAAQSQPEQPAQIPPNEQADLARQEGISLIYESADYEGGREQLLRALQLADKNWEQRAQTLRDVEAIEEYLQENSKQ